jgi:hypothetical protein
MVITVTESFPSDVGADMFILASLYLAVIAELTRHTETSTSSTKQIECNSTIKVHIYNLPGLIIGCFLIAFLLKYSVAWLQSQGAYPLACIPD